MPGVDIIYHYVVRIKLYLEVSPPDYRLSMALSPDINTNMNINRKANDSLSRSV